jgi:hypothetical protein
MAVSSTSHGGEYEDGCLIYAYVFRLIASGFPIKMLYTFPISPIRAICPDNLVMKHAFHVQNTFVTRLTREEETTSHNPDVDENIIIKWILQKQGVKMRNSTCCQQTTKKTYRDEPGTSRVQSRSANHSAAKYGKICKAF